MNSLWQVYSKKIKQNSGGFAGSILTNCEPKLSKNKQTIHVIFRNETNELEFIKLSLDLLEFLKSQLKNNNIYFTTEVNKEKSKKVLYTNREKFEHLADIYPKLVDWSQRLALELK